MTEEPDTDHVEQALSSHDLPQLEQETAAETKAPDTGTAVDTALAEWFNSSVRGSPIARNTPSYNYLQQQLPVLKALLMKGLK